MSSIIRQKNTSEKSKQCKDDTCNKSDKNNNRKTTKDINIYFFWLPYMYLELNLSRVIASHRKAANTLKHLLIRAELLTLLTLNEMIDPAVIVTFLKMQ